MPSIGRVALGVGGGVASAVFGYVLAVRPWHLGWGSTDVERRRVLPGDDLVTNPQIVATRAVTIDAPPAAVWPWLVQMGYRRAGWYSYDRFDNDGVVVRRVVPELQHIDVGDMMLTDERGGFRVVGIEPGRHLVLAIRGAEQGLEADISSVFVLTSTAETRTRLVLRLRAAFRGPRERLWGLLLFDLGDFVMMRRQLLGIRERAEAAWAAASNPPVRDPVGEAPGA